MIRQQGAVLVVSLIILLMLTLIGISGARSVLLGERMTAASRDARVALEVAESMLRKGEADIDALSDTSAFGETGWRRTAGDGPSDLFDDDTWTNASSKKEDSSLKGPDDSALAGRYYIEMSGLASDDASASDVDLSAGKVNQEFEDIQVFKIVARGEGPGGTERILVTFHGKAM